jgi:hypothetical protein
MALEPELLAQFMSLRRVVFGLHLSCVRRGEQYRFGCVIQDPAHSSLGS